MLIVARECKFGCVATSSTRLCNCGWKVSCPGITLPSNANSMCTAFKTATRSAKVDKLMQAWKGKQNTMSQILWLWQARLPWRMTPLILLSKCHQRKFLHFLLQMLLLFELIARLDLLVLLLQHAVTRMLTRSINLVRGQR